MSKFQLKACLLVTCSAIICAAEASAAVGRIPGQFGVSGTGSAQYAIPIEIPPGPKDVQPQLSLRYDSRFGIGSVGIGWSLSGLGSVSRCNQTYAQDTTPATVALILSDGYCLNGNRLRLTGGTYGISGSTYQTEVADFSNITANGSSGNGPAYFTVQGRDGLTYQYGYTDANGNGANSQVPASGAATADSWLLSKVIDRAGNNYVINYLKLTGTAVPDTILWTPTSVGAATYAYTMKFNYGANVSQSSYYGYVSGTPVTNTQLLSSITVAYSGTIVKDYLLAYQLSPTTGRDELRTVTECADASASNCLAPTTVSYQDGVLGLANTPITAINATAQTIIAKYDFNGDGITDLAFYNGTTWFVAFGSSSGYGTPVNTGITALALFGDCTGGGSDGILANNGGLYYYYQWNGSSFAGVSTGLTYDAAAELADVNGDGLPDLVYLHVEGGTAPYGLVDVITRFNTASGGTLSFASTQHYQWTFHGSVLTATLETPDQQSSGTLRAWDFDGDGRQDIALSIRSDTHPIIVSYYQLVSNGTTMTGHFVASAVTNGTPPPYFFNWNNDACTDSIWNNVIYIAGCNGTAASNVSVPGSILTVGDWDGDGRTDIFVVNGTAIGVYLGTGTNSLGTLQSIGLPYSSACTYFSFDANGDGLDDLGCWNSSVSYYPHNGSGQPADLMSSIADGYGVTFRPTYLPLSSGAGGAYSKGSGNTYPLVPYIGPLYVVSTYAASDGIGGSYNVDYHYYYAVVNVQGRGFQGIYETRSYDHRTGIYDFVYRSTQFPYTGIVTGRDTTQATMSKYIHRFSTNSTKLTLDATANNQRYFPYFATTTDTVYDVGGTQDGQLTATTVKSYGTPDIYGNFTNVSTTVTDNDPASPYANEQWSSTIATTYYPDYGTNWCLNLPTRADVTNTAPGSSITRHSTYAPDYSNCRQTQGVVEPSSATYKVTTDYTYDAFGNVQTESVTGVGMTARTTTLGWGTTGQFLTTVKNPLLQTTTFGFDPVTGKQSSRTDPNGIGTTWTYDPFGRKTLETRGDGTMTSWAYTSCVTAGCVNGNNKMTVVQSSLDTSNHLIRTDNVYLDGFDRLLVTSGQLLNGAYDRRETQYDNLGNVRQQSAPCAFASCTVYWTKNTYDILGRITQSQRPISATNNATQTTLYSYQGRTRTVTDAQGKNTTQVIKVTGKLGRTQDHNGYYVSFTHDAFGSLTSVSDNLSNTLKSAAYDYGVGAFLRTSSDIDLGNRSYTVDALGEVTAYSDNNGHNFAVTYDALSRPLIRTEPDLTTTWTWGNTASSYNIGKLQQVNAASAPGTYIAAYAYDTKGRLATRALTLPTDGTHVFDYSYKASTGQLDTINYPVSFPANYRLSARFNYQYGLFQEVYDGNASSTVWWKANGMNPRGQITQETMEDASGDPQIVSTRAYDAVTGWLSSIQTGVGSGAALQNASYAYDLVGNVTQRQDNNGGLTENFYYDNLYRLEHSTLGGSTNLQMCYDNTGGGCTLNLPGMGNITSRSDLAGGAAWTYDPIHKHEVTQAGSATYTYTYDPNGNVSSRNGNTFSWTSYNYPSYVGTGAEAATFDYGPDRQRWRMFYNGIGGVETTYYATPLFEKVVKGSMIDYRQYIYVGGRAVAVISRTSAGAVNVRSLLTDQQGSVSTIVTDSTGASYEKESFTAFGDRRDASTWSGAPASVDRSAMDGVTREGYTFQTVLGVMGLNHMNGRVQDAITGRFLSADPTVPLPGLTQSYNPYSYVNNNPLSFTDPTGFEEQPALHLEDGGGDVLPEITVESSRGGDAINYNFNVQGFLSSLESQYSAAITPPSLDETIVTGHKPKKSAPPPSPSFVAFQLMNQAQSPNQQTSTQCRASLEKFVQAGAGAAGGAVSGALIGGPGGALAGAAAGGVTGLVTGSLSGAGSPDWFAGAVGAPVGTVSTAFAAEAFTAEGATAGGMLFAGYGGLIGGAVPGAAGAAAGAGIAGISGISGLAQAGVVGAAGAAGAYATYRALDALANSHCGL